MLWNWLLLSDNVKRPHGVCVVFLNIICHGVFSIPVMHKGRMSLSVLVQCQDFVKEWTFWILIWTQGRTNFSLWQISVTLRTVTKDFFSTLLLSKYCIEFIEFTCYNRWKGMHAVTLLPMQGVCNTSTEIALSRLTMANTGWVLSFFSLVNGIDFSRFNSRVLSGVMCFLWKFKVCLYHFWDYILG